MTHMYTRLLEVDEVTPVREKDDEPTNTYEFVAATERPVRVWDSERFEVVREVLPMAGAKVRNYRRNPVVLDAHRQRGSEHIAGKSVNLRMEDGKLIARIEFDDEPGSCGARNLRLVRKGMLNALSIGYLPTGSEDRGYDESGEPIVHRTTWELLEISTTSVPADPDALKRAHEEHAMERSKTAPPAPPPAPLPAADAPPPPPEPMPPTRSVEEEAAAVRSVAEKLTKDAELQQKLVASALLAEDFDAFAEGLERQQRLLHARVLDPGLREIGGKLLAEAAEPLTFDVLAAVRAELAKRPPVGTPEPAPARSEPQPTPSPKSEPPKEPSLAAFLRSN